MTFADAWARLAYVNGWLTEPEAELLWSVASSIAGPILEIGCYYGRSTILLASLGRLVYAVDPLSDFDTNDLSGDRIEHCFRVNLANRAIGNVYLFRQKVEDWEPRPAGFAYLDGDHTYEGTKRQVEVALRCGPFTIAAHDVNDDGDGLEVKRALVGLLGPWRERVERLAVWEVSK